MRDTGGGGGDVFDVMSHEQMLKWLDQADSGTVQAAADKLAAAAKSIEKIADDLKVRPQWVSWKGEGAEAFRAWSSDLANSTFRLGDFSAGSAQWLARASEAIAGAQASIPRDVPGTDGKGAGPGARPASKSTPEMAQLAAEREAARQEAAGQMRKLGQSYQLSASQMDALERPVFPPVPGAIAPVGAGESEDLQDLARPTANEQPRSVAGSAARNDLRRPGSVSDIVATAQPQSELSTGRQSLSEAPRIGTDLDSVDTLAKTPSQAPMLPEGPASSEVLPASGRAEPGMPFGLPGSGHRPAKSFPTADGRLPSKGSITQERVPSRQVAGGVPQPRQTTPNTPAGRAPGTSRGIVGGRPTQTPAGRTPSGISRPPIVGGQSAQKSAPSAGRTGGTKHTSVLGPGCPSGGKPGGGKAVPPTVAPSRGGPQGRSLPPQTTGGVIGANTTKQEHSGRLPSGTFAPTRGGISGGIPHKEPRPGAINSTPVPPGSGTMQRHNEQT